MTTGSAQDAGRSAGGTSFRTDLQGLRAIAVVLVVLNHTLNWPGGGFVGVDVFYVISGFLITGLLRREAELTGSISLRAFYARRVRRIVPAALLVLVVTSLAAFALWFLPRALQAFTDAVSAALFVSNWHFIALRVDYLQDAAAVSPFQHYWSLSIEEQFYAAWPLLFLALFALVRGSRKVLAGAVALLLAASLVWAAQRTGSEPAAAYFDTFARAWELLAGALLAVLGTAPARLSPRARRMISLAGVLIIVAGSVVVAPSWAVPFPWVGPAVAGAVLTIWAADAAGPRSLLGNRVSQWLGDISYSLYLWHFPVIVFAESVFGASLLVGALSLPVMLGLSELSRRFVEQPVLRGPLLAKLAKAKNHRRFVARDLLLGATTAAAVVALSIAQLSGPEPLRSADSIARFAGVQRQHPGAAAPSEAELRNQISQALAATAWPAPVRTQLDRLFSLQGPDAMLAKAPGCRNSVQQAGPTLICGESGAGEALVIGDSVALSWVPTVQSAAEASHWTVAAVGFANCPAFDVAVTNWSHDPAFESACAQRRAEMLTLVRERRPAVVFLSAAQAAMISSESDLGRASAAWQSGVERTLGQLMDVPKVVVLSNPPMADNPLECSTRVGSPQSCVTAIGEDYLAKAAAEKAATAKFSNAVFIDTSSWFCGANGCPAFIDNQVVRLDGVHLTEASARAAGSLLTEALAARG